MHEPDPDEPPGDDPRWWCIDCNTPAEECECSWAGEAIDWIDVVTVPVRPGIL